MIYVALLRGINVGGNGKVSMKELKGVFENLGFENVKTYINSGNVIFSTAKKEISLVKEIEKILKKEFGFDIRVVIRNGKNISKLCKEIPKNWQNNTDQKTDILFLWDEYNNKKSLDLVNSTKVDNLMYIEGAIVWNIARRDHNKSGMKKFVGSKLYKNMTARNINTVRKLNDLMKI